MKRHKDPLESPVDFGKRLQQQFNQLQNELNDSLCEAARAGIKVDIDKTPMQEFGAPEFQLVNFRVWIPA